jgi:hypothetical protein
MTYAVAIRRKQLVDGRARRLKARASADQPLMLERYSLKCGAASKGEAW